MVFGIGMIVVPELIRQAFSFLVFAARDTIQYRFSAPAVGYVTLVHAALGAVMFGWGAALLLVLLGPFRRGSRKG